MKGSSIAALAVAALAVAAGAAGIILAVHGNSGGSGNTVDTDPEAASMDLVLTVDGVRVSVDWEDNPSVDAVKTLAKGTLTVSMSRYGGFEQTGQIGSSIVREDSHMDVGCGDIVLYNGKQICLYFDENSYDFTRLGRITGMSDTEIVDMLDRQNVTAVFTLE